MNTGKIALDLAKLMMIEHINEGINTLKEYIDDESNNLSEKDLKKLKKYRKQLKKFKKKAKNAQTEQELEKIDEGDNSYSILMDKIEKIIVKYLKSNKG